MRSCSLGRVGLAFVMAICATSMSGQNRQQPAQQQAAVRAQAAVPVPDTRPFNARDLSGIWQGSQYVYGGAMPALTAEGQRRFDATLPSYGPRAVPPARGNDYVGNCNPLGLIRNLLYRPSPMEIVQIPNRVFMRFEWTWDHREIWTDGRKLPDHPDDYLPRFNGYSVGRWDGDTFVVDTVGMDDRAWIDHFGNVFSAGAHLTERWHRTSYSTLELKMTLTDPTIYTAPWESATSTFHLLPKDQTTLAGWQGLLEDRCVPFDEIDQFNKNVRDPAGGIR